MTQNPLDQDNEAKNLITTEELLRLSLEFMYSFGRICGVYFYKRTNSIMGHKVSAISTINPDEVNEGK